MRFVLRNKVLELTKEAVETKLRNVPPELIRKHAVRVNGKNYPIKQVLSVATGISRIEFTSMDAASILRRLGFTLKTLG